jgi:hypothetical protein
MKTLNSRKIIMLCSGILAATLAAGCYGGGSGYSNDPYSYYGSYGRSYSSYNDDNSGYSYPPQSYWNSYSSGYRNGARADENRDRYQARDTERHIVVTPERGEPITERHHSRGDLDRNSQ